MDGLQPSSAESSPRCDVHRICRPTIVGRRATTRTTSPGSTREKSGANTNASRLFLIAERSVSCSASTPPPRMKEVIVLRVIQNWNMHGGIGVVLREKEGDRRFVIFVDHAVGHAIIHGLAALPSIRPLTHDLLLH